MKLSEFLDYIGSELLDDRTEMLEGASDAIWSDEAIIRQLNEAQRVLCRRAWVLEDTDLTRIDAENNKVCQIQMTENQTDYVFHKSILNIKSVRISDSDVDLLRVGYADNRLRNGFQYDDSIFWDINSVILEASGRPTRWSADMGTRTLRVRQKPNGGTAALSLNLIVVRMPIQQLTALDVEASPEVPEEYHMVLARAAAGRLDRKSVV